MDYTSVIDGLLSQHDLNSESGRRAAYERCKKYADEHIRARVEYNAFMEAVAARLNLPPVRKSSLDEDDGEPPENAKIHLTYTPRVGPELTANAEGLRYLASMLAELAKQAVEHDHLHLYADEPPMVGQTFPLTIYHEPDAWFARLESKSGKAPEDERKQAKPIAKRDLQPSAVAALCVLNETPPGMQLAKHKLYRVLSVEAYDGRKVWEKRIRESRERFILVAVAVNDSVVETFGFDLDDPEVLFFTREDVARLSSDAS
ncbi:MAG: hypothetical protein ABFE01_12100 [Phycisphaerales bacterium]